MTTPSLSISRLVRATVTLTPQAPQAENIDTLLLLGPSTVIDPVARLRSYASIEDVALDFGSTTPEYLASVLWFEQNPQPLNLNIGRWVQANAPGQLVGAPLSAAGQAIAAWDAVTTPGFLVYLDGVPHAIAPTTLAGTTNLNGVASIIQTALAAAEASTTCVWNGVYDNFTITSGTTGAASSVSFLAPPTAMGTATFSVIPTATDTLVIDGTSIAFIAHGGTPVGNQVALGTDVPTTLVALLAFLTASADTNLVKMTYSVVGNVLYIVSKLTGTAGNAYTLTAAGTSPPSLSGSGHLAGGTGTDISGMLGMLATSSGAYAVPGAAAETPLACVQLFDTSFPNKWFGLADTSFADADRLAVAAYIEAAGTPHYYGTTTEEAGVIVAAYSQDLASQLQALKYDKTCVQYSSSNPYAVMSYLARILTTNWAANNSTITLMYKQEPGIVAETLNTQQMTALEGKNCNVFVAYTNDTAIIEPGMSSSGQFTDTIVGLAWFLTTLQNDLYTVLYTSPTKIPQTDAGMHLLATVIAGTCDKAVNNGLVAEGTWTSAGFGTLKTGDYLAKGYYIYQPLVATQSPADRAARKSVPFQIAIKLGGAVHTVDAAVLVNQ
jgi:hypothetical protein